jgi:CRISPR-associated protein Cmr2
MNDAVLIFTFSPIQPFIAEARRTSDLYAASKILSKLARAVGEYLQSQGDLIYPAKIGGDVPNKLVVQVPWDQAGKIAEDAERVLKKNWQEEADTAVGFFKQKKLVPFSSAHQDQWMKIWKRQIHDFWEHYWAVAKIKDGKYQEAYAEANRGLEAAKRTRSFASKQEAGLKDTLSGRRSALHTKDLDGRDYWVQIAQSPAVFNARLRPDGRERLDAIGLVKRFGGIGMDFGARFPSTSSVASTWFLEAVRGKPELEQYREAVEVLLDDHLHKVNSDPEWPYDGDLFYKEELEPKRLHDSYGIEESKISGKALNQAKEKLTALLKASSVPLDRYYAILVFDGDNMGEHIAACQGKRDHQDLSEMISQFAASVEEIVEKPSCQGRLVYAGGDDVLALAPLSSALPMAQELATTFTKIIPDATASGGLAIVHHLYPLGSALKAARAAEKSAKSVDSKNALAVRVLKRSGETTETRSKWSDVGKYFNSVYQHFKTEALSSQFAYSVLQSAYGIPEPGEMFEAELKRLTGRHRQNKASSGSIDAETFAPDLNQWAMALPQSKDEHTLKDAQTQTESLAYWLLLAQFVAQSEKQEMTEA